MNDGGGRSEGTPAAVVVEPGASTTAPTHLQGTIQVEPWVGTCTCGWRGPFRISRDDAFADANDHAVTNHADAGGEWLAVP